VLWTLWEQAHDVPPNDADPVFDASSGKTLSVRQNGLQRASQDSRPAYGHLGARRSSYSLPASTCLLLHKRRHEFEDDRGLLCGRDAGATPADLAEPRLERKLRRRANTPGSLRMQELSALKARRGCSATGLRNRRPNAATALPVPSTPTDATAQDP
jgi:hypothetical protein